MVEVSKAIRKTRAPAGAGKFCFVLVAIGCSILIAGTPVRSAAVSGLCPAQEGVGGAGENASNDAWAPALLYDIISSPSPDAIASLYDAAFATGPSMVPQLVAALKDDRTAEFAAQSLAFIGGEAAFNALSELVDDPRDLNLRRFYYGALGEINTPQAENYLLHVIHNANNEPDRTVTEAAVLALTVGSDAKLAAGLKQAEAGLTDPVIVDDIDNAVSVIETRARYLETHRKPGGSLEEALNLYFEPAFEESSDSAPPPPAAHGPAASQTRAPTPAAKIDIEHVEFGPSRTRALASVRFQDQGERENFWIVLQKRYGDWAVASVWLNLESEGVPAGTRPAPSGTPPAGRPAPNR